MSTEDLQLFLFDEKENAVIQKVADVRFKYPKQPKLKKKSKSKRAKDGVSNPSISA